MTWKKKKNLKKALKMLERKDKWRSKVTYTFDFLPIDVIWNPQDFGDWLFRRLKQSNERFEVKLAIMKLLARIIGRHKLLIFPFYTVVIKHINPHQKLVPEILAMIAESIHDLVPPDEIHPIIEKIIDQYISEQVDN